MVVLLKSDSPVGQFVMVLNSFPIIDIVSRNNMSGSSDWDNRVMDSLKSFDLNSPEVKQQFGKFELNKSLLYVHVPCILDSSGGDHCLDWVRLHINL